MDSFIERFNSIENSGLRKKIRNRACHLIWALSHVMNHDCAILIMAVIKVEDLLLSGKERLAMTLLFAPPVKCATWGCNNQGPKKGKGKGFCGKCKKDKFEKFGLCGECLFEKKFRLGNHTNKCGAPLCEVCALDRWDKQYAECACALCTVEREKRQIEAQCALKKYLKKREKDKELTLSKKKEMIKEHHKNRKNDPTIAPRKRR